LAESNIRRMRGECNAKAMQNNGSRGGKPERGDIQSMVSLSRESFGEAPSKEWSMKKGDWGKGKKR